MLVIMREHGSRKQERHSWNNWLVTGAVTTPLRHSGDVL